MPPLQKAHHFRGQICIGFASACQRFGTHPTVLERDFNYPPLAELLAETAHIRALQQRG